MPQCEFCQKDLDNPCLNRYDTQECPDYSVTPVRPGEDIHASKKDEDE